MAQFEIDLTPSEAAEFDRVFWSFCAEREDTALDVQLTACDLGRRQRRTIRFVDGDQAAAFRRRWLSHMDAKLLDGHLSDARLGRR